MQFVTVRSVYGFIDGDGWFATWMLLFKRIALFT